MRKLFGSSLGVVVLALCLFGVAGPLLAQQGTAEIGGRVTDEQGAILPGVSIVVTNEATGVFREVTSSAEGTYLASQLVPGRYKVVARLTGFRTTERSGLLLQVGTLTSVFGNARVNTLRVARTWEHWWHGNACSRSLGMRTYPERLTIRSGEFEEFINKHTVEMYAQDRRKMGRTTVSAGIRYDLEIIPIDQTGNPLFSAGNQKSPVDRNNVAPRLGITHALDDNGTSVVRGGYGIFYNRTVLGAIDDTIEFPKFTSSAVVSFPNDSADPGPAAGRFPTDPFLINGPFLNRALLDQLYVPGTRARNNGVVIFDSPDRKQPYAHQFTVGYGRQVAQSIAVQADYIRMANKDMFLARNLNPAIRANTSRTGPITRVDAFGVLGEPYRQQVWVMENTGESNYDALNLSLEKRYANNWSGRVSYSLSSSRGTAEDQADKNTYQFQTDFNLDEIRGPAGVDRRHILSLNGRTEIPKTKGSQRPFSG